MDEDGAIRVLVIDDDQNSADLTVRSVRRIAPQAVLRLALSESEVQEALEGDAQDLIVTDWHLGWAEGDTIIARFKALWPEVPIIVYTGTGSERTAVTALKVGADDYVIKTAGSHVHLAMAVRTALDLQKHKRRVRQVEFQYRDMFDELPVGLFRTTPEGKILEVNWAAAALLGYDDPAKLKDSPVVETYRHASDRESFVEQMMRDGQVLDFEVELRRASGESFWARVDVRAIRAEHGSIRYFEGIMMDVTEAVRGRIAIEEELHRQAAVNDLLSQGLDAVDVSRIDQDALRILKQWTHADRFEFLRVASDGMTVRIGDMLAQSRFLEQNRGVIGDLLVVQDAELSNSSPVVRGLASALNDEGLRFGLAGEFNLPGGATGLFLVADTEPDGWSDERILLVRNLVQRIFVSVERIRLLDESRRRADILFRGIEVLPIGLLILDENQRLIIANDEARKHLTTIAPQGWNETAPLKSIGNIPLTQLPVPTSCGWPSIEIVEQGDNKHVFELAATHLGQEDDLGVVVVIRDVTEQVQIEQRAATQGRLAAVGQLAAGIAHDFNNLLTSMIGYAELHVRDEHLPRDVLESLDVIIDQGHKAAGLVRQILDFGRKSLIFRSTQDVGALVGGMVGVLRRTIAESVILELDLPPQPCYADVDVSSVEQILTNLVVNARDAMEGSGRCTVRLETIILEQQQANGRGVPRGKWILLSVEDMGPGIPENLRSHVFEPFYTTKEVGKGTGLGLSQVYGLVRQHGGFIEVGESPSGGAAFFVYFPESDKAPHLSDENGRHAYPQGRGETIMVVEDEPSVLLAVSRMLSNIGYEVVAAPTADDAMELAMDHQILDLVVSDVVMPGTSGLDLVENLNRHRPGLPIILMTGYPIRMDDADLRRLKGVAAVLEKPLDMRVLASTIERTLGQGKKG
ncbi:MAG: response regulator [Deltaproteobacteria bacterium]|nr:response regulator [Deltaproteobacteria bacterium]